MDCLHLENCIVTSVQDQEYNPTFLMKNVQDKKVPYIKIQTLLTENVEF